MVAFVFALAINHIAGQNIEIVSQIGGGYRTIQVVDNYAYAGEGPSLVALEVSNPGQPHTVGRLLLHPNAYVKDVFTTAGLAYVITGAQDYFGPNTPSGLHIIDIGNPSSPTLVSSCHTSSTAESVFVSGSLAHIAWGSYNDSRTSGGLQIIDISNPTSPTFRGSYNTADVARDVFVAGSFAYLAAGQLKIINISDPTSPTLCASYATYDWPHSIYVSGHLAYVGNDGMPANLEIINVIHPWQPTSFGYYGLEATTIRGVYASNGLAYVVNDHNWGNIAVLDVSHPTSPTLLLTFDTLGTPCGLCVAANVAYIPFTSYQKGGGLEILDVTNPGAPALWGLVPSPMECHDVSVQGGVGCVGAYPQNLYTIDLNHPAVPGCLAHLQVWASTAQRVSVSGNVCCVAGGGELNIVDVGHPSSPTLVGHGFCAADDVVVRANRAYVANDGLHIFDLSNPLSPTLIGSCATAGSALALSDDGNTAYIAGYDIFQAINVSNPSSPILRGSCQTTGDNWSVCLSGNLACVVGDVGLQIIDVTDPSVPTVSGLYATSLLPWDVAVSDGFACVTFFRWTEEEGRQPPYVLEIIDVSNPSSPTLRATYDFPTAPLGVEIHDGLAYVATYGSGVWVLRYAGPLSPAAPSNLTATALSSSQIHLAWHDNADNEEGFYVERKLGSAGSWSWISSEGPNAMTYQDGGLQSDTTYFYRVRAFNATGVSTYSHETSATTLAALERAFRVIAPNGGESWQIGTTQTIRWVINDPISSSYIKIQMLRGVPGNWAASTHLTTYDWIPATATSYDWFIDPNLYASGANYWLNVARMAGDPTYWQDWSDGNFSLYFPTPSGPNLTLSDCRFSPAAPTQLRPGDPLALSARVENSGGSPTGPFWVEVWGSRTGGLTLDRFLATSLHLPSGLFAGGSHSWITSTPLTSIPDGPYTVVYSVDRPREVAESNERDNRAVIGSQRLLVIRPPTQADLVVEGFAMAPNPAQSGGPVAFSGRVANRGSEPCGPFWIEFWGSWDWPYPALDFFLCDSIFVENLDPGAAVDLANCPRSLYKVPEGVFMVGCFADRDDSIAETDETNNYQFLDGQVFNRVALEARPVKTQVGADLVVWSADISPVAPVQLAPGDTITLTIELANRGSLNTGPFWLEYWGSRDGGLTLGNFLADSTRLANLAPGQTVRLTMVKRLYGIPDGPYSFVAVADRPDDVSEINEGNNRLTVAGKRLLLVRPPSGANLVIQNFDAGQIVYGNLMPGGYLRNTGTADSGPFWVEFWVCPGDPDYPWLDRFLCRSALVDNLPPQHEVPLYQFSHPVYDMPSGQYVVIAFVDRPDHVAESDETDNYAMMRGVTILRR